MNCNSNISSTRFVTPSSVANSETPKKATVTPPTALDQLHQPQLSTIPKLGKPLEMSDSLRRSEQVNGPRFQKMAEKVFGVRPQQTKRWEGYTSEAICQRVANALNIYSTGKGSYGELWCAAMLVGSRLQNPLPAHVLVQKLLVQALKRAPQPMISFDDGKYNGPRNEKFKGEGLGLHLTGGEIYAGDFRNGGRHGEGTHTWWNGATYIGEWQDNKRNGQGTFTWPSGDRYTGAWKDDLRNGQGTVTWSNGDSYIGAWKDGVFHGPGTLSQDGTKYTGDFVKGVFNGKGTYTCADRKYEGDWEFGACHGQGAYTSGPLHYQGGFVMGAFAGEATLVCKSQDAQATLVGKFRKYEGNDSAWKCIFEGTFDSPKGPQSEGKFAVTWDAETSTLSWKRLHQRRSTAF